MAKLSLRQILFVVLIIAIGLSIWRLPDGLWADIPLGALGILFIVSLGRSAAQAHRVLREQPDLSREQRWGLRMLVLELLGTAISLLLALAFSELAAARSPTFPPTDDITFLHAPMVPRDLAILAMLVAICLRPTIGSPMSTARPRRVVGALALAVLVVAVSLFWIDRMQLYYLIYVAISGVEAAQATRMVNPAVRMHRFTVAGFIGLAFAVANIFLFAGLVTFWHRRRLRWALSVLFSAGLALECCFTVWIAAAGIRELSPPMREAIGQDLFQQRDRFGVFAELGVCHGEVVCQSRIFRGSAHSLRAVLNPPFIIRRAVADEFPGDHFQCAWKPPAFHLQRVPIPETRLRHGRHDEE